MGYKARYAVHCAFALAQCGERHRRGRSSFDTLAAVGCRLLSAARNHRLSACWMPSRGRHSRPPLLRKIPPSSEFAITPTPCCEISQQSHGAHSTLWCQHHQPLCTWLCDGHRVKPARPRMVTYARPIGDREAVLVLRQQWRQARERLLSRVGAARSRVIAWLSLSRVRVSFNPT